MPKIILISGKQGAGKTTLLVALMRALVKQGYFVGSLKFADPIYTMHEFIQNYMERVTGTPRTIKDGTLLQLLGTEWGRKTKGENIWVDVARYRVQKELSERDFVLVDDARFENEFDAFEDKLSIRLEAPRHVRMSRAEGWRTNDMHPSEMGLDSYAAGGKFDLTFDTSEKSVEEIVDAVIKELNIAG